MFSGVDISLNATQVTTPTNTYPYPAMIETLLSYGADAKQSQLTSALFYADQPARMDAIDFAEANRNSGLYARSRFTAASRIVDMMGRTHADMFFQDRYLLNEVHVKIKLIRSRNSFCLMAANEFKVKIDSANHLFNHFNLTKQESMRLVLKFRNALAQIMTAIAYAEFQNVIQIDSNCNVIYDFSVWTLMSLSAPSPSTWDVTLEWLAAIA